MIPSEIRPGRRVRICATSGGHGFSYGRIAHRPRRGLVELTMEPDGATLHVPWWEIVGADVRPQVPAPYAPLMDMICRAPYAGLRP